MSFSEQQLKRIGESLSQIRIEQNLTLENVAAKTFISKRVLVAIEQGNVRELPEPFYTEALIAKYALALDASQILSQLHEEKAASEVEEAELKQAVLLKPTEPSHKNLPTLPTFQLKSSHLYLIYLVLVILAVRAIAFWVENPVAFDSSKISEEKASLENPNSSDRSTSTTISSTSSSQFISQSNSNNSDSVVVDINLKDRCWLKVVVDGKVEFEGTLSQGTQKRWTGREQINIIAGNAGGVVITYNNGQEKLLGKPGQVEEVTYTVN
jgi:cytoskeletal protein RodZ